MNKNDELTIAEVADLMISAGKETCCMLWNATYRLNGDLRNRILSLIQNRVAEILDDNPERYIEFKRGEISIEDALESN